MLDINLFRENPDKIKGGIIKRGGDPNIVDKVIELDEEWRELETKKQKLRHEQKKIYSKNIDLKKAKILKNKIKELENKIREISEKRYKLLITIPNIPFDDVLVGKDERENRSIKKVGDVPKFDFEIKDHTKLGEMLDIIDTKKAAKVSGTRFYYLKNEGAILEFALIKFAMDMLTKEGFIPIIPPVMIRQDVYEKMGRLTPEQNDERYHLQTDNLYLIGSAEHTLGPLQMDETLEEENMPIRYIGFSSCFRREAGSYGKDTKGIFRVHQFDKVEMYAFTTPDKSEKEHIFLLSMQEKINKKLEIPYQVVEICTGDMGPTDARQYDIEAWIPSQNKYREIGSCSNTTDYQTRGINTKVRLKNGKSIFAHALNATGIAISRTLIAIIENNQTKDGNIIVPKELRKYTGFDKIIPK